MRERQVLHIENKETNEHYYFGALSTIQKYFPDFPYHTVKYKPYSSVGWENNKYKLRAGKLRTAFSLSGRKYKHDTIKNK